MRGKKSDNQIRRRVIALVLGIGVAAGYAGAAEPLVPLKVNGRYLVDAKGQRVTLKGCNLGNWLLLEPWMLGIHDSRLRDQHDIFTVLNERFGSSKAKALLDVYKENWITSREFEIIRSFDFNLVRIPFHHSLLATEEKPFELRPDAFRWLDRGIELAEQAGVYVVLDMHGAPGGQSTDMTSGRIGENLIWDNAIYQKRTAWLWQQIARRYRDRAAVVAYDLINEPWSDYKQDVSSTLVSLVGEIHDEIRRVDGDTLILAPGDLQRVDFYGEPRTRGWQNVGFTEHFYPGLFHRGEPCLETHALFIDTVIQSRIELMRRFNSPYLVGEFNVVFDWSAQPELMRNYYEIFNGNGWMATMWSLRMIHPAGGVHRDNWFLATNAEPYSFPDLHKDSYEMIEAGLRKLGTQKLDVDEELRQELTTASPRKLLLAGREPKTVTRAKAVSGWSSWDIGGAKNGKAQDNGDGSITVWGAGDDIWDTRDSFHFLHRKAAGDFEVSALLKSFTAFEWFAKAGLMLREDDSSDAANAFIHVFSDGHVILAYRKYKGGETSQKQLGISGFPVRLTIGRKGKDAYVAFTDYDGKSNNVAVPAVPSLEKRGRVGLAVLSHDGQYAVPATFCGLTTQSGEGGIEFASEKNLLRNGSFEMVENAENASDRAQSWNRWGQWFNRQDNWQPKKDGECMLAYHHWKIESNDNSGVYQDVTGLSPGERVTFTVYALGDKPSHKKRRP